MFPAPLRLLIIRSCSSEVSLTERYTNLVATGALKHDPNQARVLEHLEKLRRELSGYQPEEPSLLQRVSRCWVMYDDGEGSVLRFQLFRTPTPQKKIKGIYIHGSVGMHHSLKLRLPLPTHSSLSLPPSPSSHCNLFITSCLAGSGKTMLMDMFYNSVSVARKQRIHFNEFMLNAHNSTHPPHPSFPSLPPPPTLTPHSYLIFPPSFPSPTSSSLPITCN